MKTREGFALPAVIFTLAIMGVLAVVSLRTAQDEHRSSRALRESGAALYVAEAGANLLRGTVIDTSGTTLLDSLAATLDEGDSVDYGWSTLPSGATYRPMLYRIDAGGSSEQRFLLTVEGRGAGQWGGQRVVGVGLRGVSSVGTVPAAITAGGGLQKNSSAGTISGVDACGGSSTAGLTAPTGGYTGDPAVLVGDPPLEEVADPLAELQATGIDWAGILAGSFDYTIVDEDEFPDFSTRPADFYPSILVTDSRIDLRGPDHDGRGLLVVPDELRINNDWVWDGIILVGRKMQSNGKMTLTGAVVTGMNLLLGVDPSLIPVSKIGPGTAQITYDSCLWATVSANFGLPSIVPLAARAWGEVMR